jgi:hypothetical protein
MVSVAAARHAPIIPWPHIYQRLGKHRHGTGIRRIVPVQLSHAFGIGRIQGARSASGAIE